MKILVTGGRGFIGRHLVRALRQDGHEVWSFDLQHSAHPQHLRGDIRAFGTLERYFDAHGFELVYHLCAEAGRWNGESHYEALWTTNVIGTKHLIRLQEARRFRLVFMSSSEVYGDYEGQMDEAVMDQVAIRQLNDYAMTKWVGEMQLQNSAEMFGTESVRVRMFNVYGPGEYFGDNRGVIARFIHHALHGIPYTVYLGHERTSTYVTDAARTLANIATRFQPGQVYNIGGTEMHDIRTMSELILQELGLSDDLVTYTEQEAFTTRTKRVDVSRSIQELEHAPLVDLKTGLARTIAWARQAYAAEDEA